MENKNEKSEEIVKSIKLLEGVLKTTSNKNQKERVRKDINKLRGKLQDMYPNSDLHDLENAIYSNLMAIPQKEISSVDKYTYLNKVEFEVFSPYSEDKETNEAASIMKFFEERIWTVISDQHTKLDFSSSGERETLYRKLDECIRAFKTFGQTLEDIEKARSTEYLNQLQLMRVRHGRLFLFEIHHFFKSAGKFIRNLIANHDAGGNMILNPEDEVSYADYEEYKTFQSWIVFDSIKWMLGFVNEAIDYINVPNLKQM